MSIKPWKILRSKYLVQDQWLALRADTCLTAEGVELDPFYIFEKQDWAHVMAFDNEGRVLIVRQYRHGSKTICAELPCGVIDDSDLSPLDAAKRELLEETGCVAEDYEAIKPVYANPARQTNWVRCFVAYNARKVVEPNLDVSENIESEFVSLEALFRLIDSGEFSQSLHISSVYQALRKTGKLNLEEVVLF
ncbi:MAG: NUDIX hydrolase [Deltaproteobacteria bacterium]|jgi:ADP-ribose pyrophosphatase|nr:NUDIX hydrolase [Deltaproteobacteria bacterium]MBT4638013.1 NUDIX hydrolase [Deltaproteobacteria bacterium]MBT6501063.1 NUDIX hydrolase [Deltaproteobacteria bacterium]MBT7155956.1 NUDIX hydrolase [Deltaproteobacteria bacterium]MBT7715439.1 NUDIX hydrolase [Deltaproteobacteria bacterium]